MTTSREPAAPDFVGLAGIGDTDRAWLGELRSDLAGQLRELAARSAARVRPRGAGPLGEQLAAWLARELGELRGATAELGLARTEWLALVSALRGGFGERIATHYKSGDARAAVRSIGKWLDLVLATALWMRGDVESAAEASAREREMRSGRLVAIQTLSSGLAHEVRNPLNSARLQLELLERRLRREGDEPRLTEPVAMAQGELDRLTRMLNDFLAFARPPALALGEHDVVALAREVIAGEQALAAQREIAVTLAAPAALAAQVDAAKLRQIVQNLVRNAIEAVAAGGHVTVTIGGDASSLALRVEDDGPGISDAVRGRIFEPFFSTKETGTGLGMSIVHSMVALHGGTIAIESTAHGTRIDVAIPR